MAKNSLQEKFQASYPFKPEDGENWMDYKQARRPRPVSGGYSSNSHKSELTRQANPRSTMVPEVDGVAARQDVPSWTDMRERVMKENGGMKLVTSSETDVSHKMMERHSLKSGYSVIGMKGTDDTYTGENMDHFYGEVQGDDDAGNSVTGFVERNNYLDRL